MLVKKVEYIGFCFYHRFYLLCPPVIFGAGAGSGDGPLGSDRTQFEVRFSRLEWFRIGRFSYVCVVDSWTHQFIDFQLLIAAVSDTGDPAWYQSVFGHGVVRRSACDITAGSL